MSTSDSASTKHKILDQAELAYATTGMTDFTLRTLTEHAGVNLAAINYHFKSKQSLVEAMLMRVLTPVCDEQAALLRSLQAIYGADIQPTHVLSATLLPILRAIHAALPQRNVCRIDFLQRAATDTNPSIRIFLARHFAQVSQAFDEAFKASTTHLPSTESLWRTRLFCNALPGSVSNQNVLLMSLALLAQPDMQWRAVLVHFGLLVETIMAGNADPSHIEYLISDMLESLADTDTLDALNLSGVHLAAQETQAPA